MISSLIFVMIFEFVLTCFWDIWCHKLETHVKINFQNLNFTVWSQFYHKNHTNHINYQAQDDHMWWYNHSAAILAEFKKTKHAEYEDDKREVMSHENDANNNKKRNKNKK